MVQACVLESKLFKCKVCDEKEKRIQDLLSQITHLRDLAYPNRALSKQDLLRQAEFDRIISDNREDEENIELESILDGSYDNLNHEIS